MGERRTCPTCGESYPQDVIFCPKDGAPLGGRKTELQDDAYLGLELAGQFKLEQLVGIGAMGRVYRAHQAGIGRDVAVKILHRELLTNETLIRRFHQEAKVASRLLHPNVVQVLMTGQLPRVPDSLVGGEAYLVMEYLDGISLRSALAAAGGAMPLPRALHVLLQVCDAVGEAHAQKIVHRDLKPENVMLVRRGDDPDFIKVLDFGVAKIDLGEESVATQAGAVFGTARYVSPEGARGDKVGPPSDVYALATMLFQTLSGETPFDGENPVAILVKHANAEPPDVRSVPRSSYVPEPIAQAIAKNLSKQPSARCPDSRAFGRLLIDAARQSGLSPEDLALRSTLLGGSGAVNLSSLQRTKSLGLTPELAAQMRGDSASLATPPAVDPPRQGPRGTAYVEGSGGGSATQLVEPQEIEKAGRISSAAPTQISPDTQTADIQATDAQSPAANAPAGQATDSAHGPAAANAAGPNASSGAATSSLSIGPQQSPGGEPRFSSPPLHGLLGDAPDNGAPPSAPAHSSPAHRGQRHSAPPHSSPADSSPRHSEPQYEAFQRDSRHSASTPSARPSDLDEHEKDPPSRALLLVLCFVLGAALSVGLAYRMGVFERKTLSAASYAEQARSAMEAGRWDSPPGNNVREITDAALQHWPRHPELISVRRSSAERLVTQAEAAMERPKEAERLLRIASELDPDNRKAKQLLGSLSRAAEPTPLPVAQPADPPTSEAPRPPRPRPSGSGGSGSSAPSAGPSAAPPPTASQPNIPAPPASAGGRWL